MSALDFVILSAITLVGLEVVTTSLVVWLRGSCAWLITKRDRLPKIDKRGLDAFMEHGWDPELGWVRKPNTRHGEMGRKGVRTSYSLDRFGARTNPGLENQPVEVLAYGDSYTFARQVDNHEAWPHLLSQVLNANVANFGVGNYGLDQAQLRLEREFERHPAKVVIMGVVPETICRIHSYWKHFSEYGNTFAFKPRFVMEDGELTLLDNLINTPEKYFQIESYYDQLAANDYFYKRKFCHDLLKFPFLLSLLKSWNRNSAMIWHALTDRLGITRDAAFISVMDRNIDMTMHLFRDPDGAELFRAVCHRFKDFCHERGAEPILLMMPQLMDIKRIRAGNHYYADLLQSLENEMTVIDLAPALLAHDKIDELFIHDHYGGHLSEEGNVIVARIMEPLCRTLLGKTAPAPAKAAAEYPFARGDLLDQPNTYFYTLYRGKAFLDAWQRQRCGVIGDVPAAAAATEDPIEPFEQDGKIDTALLLAHLAHQLENTTTLDENTRDWLEKVLKKFEVFKRIHRAYDGNFRAADRDDHKDPSLYLLMSEVFERAWRKTGHLVYLNALLKGLDTLSSLHAELGEDARPRLAALITAERKHVGTLAAGAGVSL
jgi:hypothetical protein